MNPRLTLLAPAVAVATLPLSALAITPASSCSFADVSGVGVTVTDCIGYYTGNLDNAADFAAVKSLLLTELPGAVLGSAILEQDPVSSGAGFGGFNIASINPARGRGGISNVAPYSTVTAVPEPESHMPMLAGLGAIGWIVRRRRSAA